MQDSVVENDDSFSEDLAHVIRMFQKVILDYNNGQNVLPTLEEIHELTGRFIHCYHVIQM